LIRLFYCIFALLVFVFPFELMANPVEVVLKLNLKAPQESKDVRVWIPYPVTDENQKIGHVQIEGNYTNYSIERDKGWGNSILYAEWKNPGQERVLTYTFRAERNEIVKKEFPKKEEQLDRKLFEPYLAPTSLGPTGGKVKELAEKITAKETTILGKSRAIYDWIVDNMYRDPNIKGCGFGRVEQLLISLGGKCGDISSVYVALARSAGVPSREIFGIRIPAGKEGVMTKSQHCWAEFYLPGYGWVPVDPADVRKAMLEKKLQLGQEKEIREYYFGAVDNKRIAYGTGRDLILAPPQKSGPLNYFMYPYAEVDGQAIDDLFGFDIGYTIIYRAL
ncbi:transglutaminase family protein, partial [bacterium]|nr:transglutaminase family protein [bacterium]